ncbi:hypothetical protein EXIGLDRAFT_750773 [Exidia glandulosa HHB12029]|uniref:Uncharacterized protein n=1 Tax=Exidia glandulosa HHB12029 TaxID=1314781 RepID=A0A165G8H5_EXIGL|nr:hypothetical protein EXIGLDRAFT_839186 [Exidia glandulosa HHB12029]KZV90141.1 hypothetical protein EXIGLDRAFT_750773 [Exidia glandulosa HHB12029]
MKFVAALALAVLGASSVSADCRPFNTTCNRGINSYWGSDFQRSINNIPAGRAGHLLGADGYKTGAIVVHSVCVSCKYNAYDDEIKCMAQDIINKCGGGDAFHREARAQNTWYYVDAGPVGS